MATCLSWMLGLKEDNEPRTGLGDLPESCVAVILGRLSPLEICKLARVNKTFYLASLGDGVWGSKLPENYEFLVSKLFGYWGEGVTKRDIYRRLCKPIRFDSGNKEIWIMKNSGKMLMSISWKGLTIANIDDRRRWSFITTDESRFHSIAYLQNAYWFEAGGEVEFSFPAGTYSLIFRLHMGRFSKEYGKRVCNSDQVRGWDIKPVTFQLSVSNGQHSTSEYFLKNAGKWVNYNVGYFTVGSDQMPVNIRFSMAQIDCTHIKGGLCLDSVMICPCELAEGL